MEAEPNRIRWEQLSDVQLACLKLAAQPLSSKQIAVELGLKHATVDTYISRAVRELGFTDRKTAIRALRAELEKQSRSRISDVDDSWGHAFFAALERLPWPFPTRSRPSSPRKQGETILSIVIAAIMLLAVASLFLLAMALILNARDRAALSRQAPPRPENVMSDTLRTTPLSHARLIARDLTPAERTIDEALLANTALLTTVVSARLAGNHPAETGHTAIMKIVSSMSQLGEARNSIVAGHRELAGVRDVLGLDASEVGCTVGKPVGSATVRRGRVAAA